VKKLKLTPEAFDYWEEVIASTPVMTNAFVRGYLQFGERFDIEDEMRLAYLIRSRIR